MPYFVFCFFPVTLDVGPPLDAELFTLLWTLDLAAAGLGLDARALAATLLLVLALPISLLVVPGPVTEITDPPLSDPRESTNDSTAGELLPKEELPEEAEPPPPPKDEDAPIRDDWPGGALDWREMTSIESSLFDPQPELAPSEDDPPFDFWPFRRISSVRTGANLDDGLLLLSLNWPRMALPVVSASISDRTALRLVAT